MDFFQTLSPETLKNLGKVYTEDCYFQDPFNQFNGCDKLSHVFADMFERLNNPHFIVTETVGDDVTCVILWDFNFAIKRYQPNITKRIQGVSHIRFAAVNVRHRAEQTTVNAGFLRHFELNAV